MNQDENGRREIPAVLCIPGFVSLCGNKGHAGNIKFYKEPEGQFFVNENTEILEKISRILAQEGLVSGEELLRIMKLLMQRREIHGSAPCGYLQPL